MKRISLLIALLLTLCISGLSLADPVVPGPGLIGSYLAVTTSVTAATSATIKAVAGSTTARSIAVLKNIGPTYDLYWGEGASISTVNTWNKLVAGAETTIYTCNFAPGTWGYTNKGVYIYVSPTPYTADVAQFRSYRLIRSGN
jgi:hypothetical protein